DDTQLGGLLHRGARRGRDRRVLAADVHAVGTVHAGCLLRAVVLPHLPVVRLVGVCPQRRAAATGLTAAAAGRPAERNSASQGAAGAGRGGRGGVLRDRDAVTGRPARIRQGEAPVLLR